VLALDATGAASRWATLPGMWGTPTVAIDGTTGGVSGDRRTLILQKVTYVYPAPVTHFAVLRARTLKLQRVITLHGDFSFDAISPDGRTLYLIQHPRPGGVAYKVRAYDIPAGRLLKRAITDPTRWGPIMHGVAMARVASADGSRDYTLYDKGGGRMFIHALDTVHGKALCIDLPRVAQGTTVGLALSQDDRVLTVTRDGAPFQTVDTRTYVMAPVVQTTAAATPTRAASASGEPVGLIAAAVAAALAAAVAVGLARRGTLPMWRPRSD
jgi:hypothetical protein